MKWTDVDGNVHYGDTVPREYQHTSEAIFVDENNFVTNEHGSPSARRQYDSTSVIRERVAKHSAPELVEAQMTEEECQRDYGMSCDKVNNWQADAKAACKKSRGGDRCDDEDFLAAKYKPRTLAQKRLQATRNACRRRESCGSNTVIIRR